MYHRFDTLYYPVYAKVTEVHTFYRKMEFCTTYMGVNDMQAAHMTVKIIATLFSL